MQHYTLSVNIKALLHKQNKKHLQGVTWTICIPLY